MVEVELSDPGLGFVLVARSVQVGRDRAELPMRRVRAHLHAARVQSDLQLVVTRHGRRPTLGNLIKKHKRKRGEGAFAGPNPPRFVARGGRLPTRGSPWRPSVTLRGSPAAMSSAAVR